MEFKSGDLVIRKSYKADLIFKIEKIYGDFALLRSMRMRLMADAPLDDLKLYKKTENNLKKDLMFESYEYIERQQRNIIINNSLMRNCKNGNLYREKPGTILHLDGDKNFLELSLQNYHNLNLDVKGVFIKEKGQPEKVLEYLQIYRPDILVLTGHDGNNGFEDHRTSQYFIKAVKIARSFDSDLDNLVIFAGACQSDYKQLIESGANFASSPKGGLIHFLDPILAVEKIAYTSVSELVSVKDIVKNTITGEAGIGGIETFGKLRLCFP